MKQFIQDCTRCCSNELASVDGINGKMVTSYMVWVTPDNARRVAEMTREETIEIACRAFCIYCDPNDCDCECNLLVKFREIYTKEVKK